MSDTQDIPPQDEPAADYATAPPPAFVAELPGRRLKLARESRALSVSDVASALKFSPRQVEALEADDYNSLQGATFVRGFVRSYARYLKLPPEPLLALLESEVPGQSGVRPPDDTGAFMPNPGASRQSPWIAGAALLALLAAGILVWHLLAPLLPSMPAMPSMPSMSRSEVAVEPPKVAAVQTQPDVVAPVARIEQQAAAPMPIPVALPPGGRQLQFTFTDKSWLEVRDADQRVVLSGEFPGGGSQVASGKAPFHLWIGKASAVKVLNGEREVDLKPYTAGEVARLTLE